MYSPSELIRLAKEKNITVLALTDHDTVSGLDEAETEASKSGIKFIRGIELNIEWPTGEFHLLGLGLKEISKDLEKVITMLQENRNKRNNSIIEKMRSDGIDCDFSDIQKLALGKVIGRPHFAEYLVNIKKVKNRQLAFDKYLARGRPYYEPHHGANLDEAVVAIKSSGGVPVLAHPLSLYVSWGKIEPVLSDIHERGVEGLEAYHPGARLVECQRLEKLAEKLGFFVTAGSDFHGEKVRADRKLGITAGGKKIEEKFYESLKNHL
jgi:predicted metal-dependent phosphoesterase TrpH